MARTPGSIPVGSIPGWPSEFVSSGKLTFDHEISEEAARWWQADIFDRVHLFPGGFAEALSDGLPGEHSYVYRQIDPVARSIRLEMTGASSLRVPIWIHGQELRLQKEMVYESAVLIAEGYQGEGLGRKIASNVYNMARGLDLSQITLDARMTGKYFWAKLGFLPDHGSWEFRLRDGIRAKLATLGGQVGDRRRRQIMHLLPSYSRPAGPGDKHDVEDCGWSAAADFARDGAARRGRRPVVWCARFERPSFDRGVRTEGER